MSRIPESALPLIHDLERARLATETALADGSLIALDDAWRNASVLQASLLALLLEAKVSPKAAKRIALD